MVIVDTMFHRYYAESDTAMYLWTIFTKDESCRRGEYAEEIDVLTNRKSVTAAKKVATEALKKDYIPGLRVSKVMFRWNNVNEVI